MKSVSEIRSKFLNFFNSKGHFIDREVPLLSQEPGTLFVIAGMQPQKAYLMGKNNPNASKVVSAQRCIRTNDIESIGDNTHLTNFIMMGHFSFRDYYKEDSIAWTLEFFCNELGLDKEKMSVTCFEGNSDAPKDLETAGIWQRHGIPNTRIYFLGKKDNWWEVEGQPGPAGPDSELFYDTGLEKCSDVCAPGCSCNKYVEICNNVFMQYQRTEDGKYITQSRPSVDSGFGLERIAAVVNNLESVFDTDIYKCTMVELNKKTGNLENEKSKRIICDHLRSIVFLTNDGVQASNVGAGYILRRLVRRSIRKMNELNLKPECLEKLAEGMIDNLINIKLYPDLASHKQFIITELKKEIDKFAKTLKVGEKELNHIIKEMQEKKIKEMPAKLAFRLYHTFGFPVELTSETLKEYGFFVNEDAFNQCMIEHQQLSRNASIIANQAKGGMVEQNEKTIKLHTATHLLNAALKEVLGKEVYQKGSNITSERLRFDFSCERKPDQQELKRIEQFVNNCIEDKVPVEKLEMLLSDAKEMGAEGVFDNKYSEKVSVYKIGNISCEICGGPHVKNTSELESFKILGVENIGAGIKRIKANVEKKTLESEDNITV